jgi:hypothetical protein
MSSFSIKALCGFSAPRTATVLVLFFGAGFLANCSVCPLPCPRDLKFVSVDAVELRNASEIPKYGDKETKSEPLLRVRFSSEADFARVCRNELSLYNEKWLCDGGPNNLREEVRFYSEVCWSDHCSPEISCGPKFRSPATQLYEIYLQVRQEQEYSFQAYDLRNNPQDVCFRLSGGDEIGRHFQSNFVIIPKQEITRALAESSQALP